MGVYMNKKTLTSILKFAALNDELKTKDYKVLLYLIHNLRNDELITISQLKIADDLNIARSDVSKSIKKLINNEILQSAFPHSGWNKHIRLHPYELDDITELIWGKLYDEDEDEDED